MLQIRAQPTRTITAERMRVAQQLFEAAGFDDNTFAPAETVDSARDWIIDNMDSVTTIMPKYVIGDLTGLQGEKHRRCLMAFIRRVAQFLHGSVARKRIQYHNEFGRNTTTYQYKIIF